MDCNEFEEWKIKENNNNTSKLFQTLSLKVYQKYSQILKKLKEFQKKGGIERLHQMLYIVLPTTLMICLKNM